MTTEDLTPTGNDPANPSDDRRASSRQQAAQENQAGENPETSGSHAAWSNTNPGNYPNGPREPYPTPYPGEPYGQPAQRLSKPKKPLWKRWWFWLLAVLLTLVLLLGALSALGLHLESEQRDEAAEQCREKVLNRAKYPGGVVFQDEPEVQSDKTTDANGDAVWKMAGYVDFPNGFGTPVRMWYTCTTELSNFEIVKTSARVEEDRR